MIPLCSAQYRRMFGTTRIPGLVADRISHVPGSESNYCVCCRNGKWFKVPLTTPFGRRYSPAELEVWFEALCEEEGGEVKAGEENLPALTALGREEWALAREEFFLDGHNKASLETIEKVLLFQLPNKDIMLPRCLPQAAFVLMFDDNSPAQVRGRSVRIIMCS